MSRRGPRLGARRRLLAARALAVAAVGAWSLHGASARAGDPKEKDQCIEAADQGQQLRDESKYLVAREAFARCERDTCPAMVRQDCTGWLRDLDDRMPTVVLGARDDKGNDLMGATVSLDGVAMPSGLDGKPVAVDPGEHLFRFQVPGYPPFDQRAVIRTGEKNRVIAAVFRRPAPVVAASPSLQGGPARARRISPAAWAFGAAALAAFGTEAYFGVSGLTERSGDLGAGGCAPRCSSDEKNAIQTKFLVADVALGVGLVSAGVSAYFFLFAPPAREQAVRASADFGFGPAPGGGVVTVHGRF